MYQNLNCCKKKKHKNKDNWTCEVSFERKYTNLLNDIGTKTSHSFKLIF